MGSLVAPGSSKSLLSFNPNPITNNQRIKMENKKATFILGTLIIFAWLVQQIISPPSPTPTPPPPIEGYPLLKSLATLLGILGKIRPISNAEAAVPENSLTPANSTLNLQNLVEKYNLKSLQDVREFDAIAQEKYDDCTEEAMLNEEKNAIAIREKRITCLYRVGYDNNDLVYIGTKLNRV
jgi:hypothetical protein